jgi:hypothetical protein
VRKQHFKKKKRRKKKKKKKNGLKPTTFIKTGGGSTRDLPSSG